ncbi:MAG TPA: glycosyltransferase [Verrucomicrobiae bacterium]|jgi:glycosyltransferase involved in cell wall biosynthesis
MKRALIATLFNEADNVLNWWQSLCRQTVLPDEIIIVDGGSRDGTWEKLQELARQSPIPSRLKQQRCNIAEGRNLAIQLTNAEIIAATDAGCFTENNWFDEITRPLIENKKIDVVGGRSIIVAENEFQKLARSLESPPAEPTTAAEVLPSSRNVAFRRQAWLEVGGYPEWLTLTAEDALFNFELQKIGKVFHYQPEAVVRWPMRENETAYLKMCYTYGYGAAEAQLYAANFQQRLVTMIFPPLLLLSRHRFKHFGFRWRKNTANARGWLAGRWRGQPVPKSWKSIDGVLLSPEAQKSLATLKKSSN